MMGNLSTCLFSILWSPKKQFCSVATTIHHGSSHILTELRNTKVVRNIPDTVPVLHVNVKIGGALGGTSYRLQGTLRIKPGNI